jgi:hypothetical protein
MATKNVRGVPPHNHGFWPPCTKLAGAEFPALLICVLLRWMQWNCRAAWSHSILYVGTMQGFFYANGVALSPDESYVVMAETDTTTVHKVWVKGPQVGYHMLPLEPLAPLWVARHCRGPTRAYVAVIQVAT